ncbi:ParB/RepB/Spo0J family partition protein [Nitrogeniibacter aestuarii]|uniref:ParB/RepB/Spo0J family partition protein n=1 Tax=Nitrogeniibacter aestuarii TaxID=2815343 RepID=UPI001E367878|nr:ParB/RepB/Spo0J family partition protein [Nitrogeniibacter aestuarii]
MAESGASSKTRRTRGINASQLSSVANTVVANAENADNVRIAVDKLYPDPQNVRKKKIDPKGMKDFIESIKTQGVIEPLIVHAEDDGRFMIICGQRRWVGAMESGLKSVPCVVKRGLSRIQIRKIQVHENNEREDLSLHDQVIGVAGDIEQFGMEEAKSIWNRSVPWLTKRKQAANFCDEIQELMATGMLTDLEKAHTLSVIRKECERGKRALSHVEREKAGPTEFEVVINDFKSQGEAADKKWTRDALRTLQDRVGARLTREEEARQQRTREPSVSKKSATPSGHSAGAQSSSPSQDVLAGGSTPSGSEVSEVGPQTQPTGAHVRHQLDAADDQASEAGLDLKRTVGVVQQVTESIDAPNVMADYAIYRSIGLALLPALGELGGSKAIDVLKRLQKDIKGCSPAELLEQLSKGDDPPLHWRL